MSGSKCLDPFFFSMSPIKLLSFRVRLSFLVLSSISQFRCLQMTINETNTQKKARKTTITTTIWEEVEKPLGVDQQWLPKVGKKKEDEKELS